MKQGTGGDILVFPLGDPLNGELAVRGIESDLYRRYLHVFTIIIIGGCWVYPVSVNSTGVKEVIKGH